jgi:hypothetical protein
MLDSISHLALFTGTIVSGYLLLRKLRAHTSVPLPPDPPSYPLMGQLLYMPRSSEEHEFAA